MSLVRTTRWCKPNGLNTQHVIKVRQTQKTPLVCLLPHRPHMTLLLSLPLKSHDIYPHNPLDLSTLYLNNSYLPQPQKAFSLKLHSPKNGYQEITQIASNSSNQADRQEVLKLRKETRLSRPRRPSFGCPERPLCSICWRKQKQIHCAYLYLK